MGRSGTTGRLAASPTMVGAVTTMVVSVAVFLSYNANQGLPFVPVYRVGVEVPNSARMLPNNDVRIGGSRVGVVESIEAVRPSGDGDGAAARLNLKIDRDVAPLPTDSVFRIRYVSTFGLKYLEVIRGTGEGAPEGFSFDGTDDAEPCRLPVDLASYSDSVPASAQNGCFQPQAEFDDLANGLDGRTRRNLRVNLDGLGSGVAGRGAGVNQAVSAAKPLLRDIGPIARTLAARGTDLPRFIRALSRTATAMASVDVAVAESFTNARTAFEAISRDPEALAESITEAVPLLERGPGQLARQRALLGDVAELAHRLNPGARDLVPTLPVLNDALTIGGPVLRRTPPVASDLHLVGVELRDLIDMPATASALTRLSDTVDNLHPALADIVPAQTVCNYFTYFATFLPEHLSQRSTIGYTQRNSIVTPYPPDSGPFSLAGVTIDFPGEARSTLTGYTGIPADGLAGPVPNPAEDGLFKPHDLPIGHGPVNAPHGQLTPEYPDCGSGQFGYPLGQLLLEGQPVDHPGIAVGDYPGSLGPTTLYLNRDGTRELRDTRVPSRAPTSWELNP